MSNWPHTGRMVRLQVCRDVQKSAKNAVYSAHKGDSDRAQKLLQASR